MINSSKFGKESNLRKIFLEVVLLFASVFVYSLAFPSFISTKGFGFLSLIALIPVIYVVNRAGWVRVGIYGFFFGWFFYRFFNYWLASFHPLANYVVQIIKGTEMIFLFYGLKAMHVLFKKHGYILQALVWVVYAFLSQSWFAGYPYGTIAYALYRYRFLIQIASLCGIWGVIFLMIWPQAFIAAWLPFRKEKNLWQAVKEDKIASLIYAGLLAFTIVFGIVTVGIWNNKEPAKNWKVITVQHSADSWKGGLKTYTTNFHNLKRLTLQALAGTPDADAVIWSETAFVPSVHWHTTYKTDEETGELVNEFITFGKELPVPLVTGNPEGWVKDESAPADADFSNRKDYNTVIFFDGGQIRGTYRKQHLVPFTEHFPYEKQMPRLYNLLLANDYHWWETGTESYVFTTDSGIRFSTPICFEDTFGYLTADFVKNGADVLVNMTNDSWSGAVSAEMQHAAIATFRSIETRRATIRGTNSGITCLITPTGKIVGEMKPFSMGWNAYDVPVYEGEKHTLYTNTGDFAAVFSTIAVLGFLLFGIVREIWNTRKRRSL